MPGLRRHRRCGRRPLRAAVALVLSLVASRSAPAAELQARSAQAYDAFLQRAQSEFLERAPAFSPAGSDGVLTVGPKREDGIIGVPGGLVHNWRATAVVRGVTLDRVVATSRAYASYSTMYRSVLASELLSADGDRYRVRLRIQERAAGVSAVLEIRTTARYIRAGDGSVFVLSNADEIHEVKNVGAADERLMPAGHDSGYLWRAATLSHFVAVEDGVLVEMETVGLSRRFPALLGWFIEPIARLLGRKSVETSLNEFLAAVRRPDRSP